MAYRHGRPQRLRRDPSRWQARGDDPRWSELSPRSELFALRSQVHREFDPLWRSKTKRFFVNRPAAYAWLASALGIDREAHISEFDAAMCHRALAAIRRLKT